MGMQSIAKRRRAQAKNGYMNVAPLVRPHYKKRSAAAAQRHLEMMVLRENERRMRSKKK